MRRDQKSCSNVNTSPKSVQEENFVWKERTKTTHQRNLVDRGSVSKISSTHFDAVISFIHHQ